jgi:ABC-type antimicrobial peptide transport system permease subunit
MGPPPVAVVNATLARQLFGTAEITGRRVRIAGSEMPPMEIVGVVNDARSASPRTSPAAIYYPAGQNLRRLSRAMCLVVRAGGDPVALTARLRASLKEVEARLPIVRMQSVSEQLDSVLFEERLQTGLSIFLAALAVVMTCVGLYGVVAFTTARRTNELGIRLALGATPASITRLVVRETGAVALAGIGLGLPLTVVSARWLSTRLFGVGAADPLTMIVATALMLVVVSLAAFVPAHRASRIDPIAALRAE